MDAWHDREIRHEGLQPQSQCPLGGLSGTCLGVAERERERERVSWLRGMVMATIHGYEDKGRALLYQRERENKRAREREKEGRA